jgi:hypothetical protein
VVVLAARRDEVDRLNSYCRQVLAKHGRLGTERLRVEDREVAVGDRVVCGHNALDRLGIANGSRGLVTALDPKARTLSLRLDGSEREVTLPRWYLDGRSSQERNRRVDLAYATTGHRAQGLTKWRALVRVTGAEDVNWFNVQLSRARQDTRLYAVVGPEPHDAAGELDLPEIERGDAFSQVSRALNKDGSQRLALDTTSTPDARRLSTRELRAERDRLAGRLAGAPRDRARELGRATERREQAEAELTAVRREQPATMLRLGRGQQRAGVQAGAAAVAAQQADRAIQREQELRAHQQRRVGWLEQHAGLVGAYQQVVRTLAWQRRARGLAHEAINHDRPGYLREALGPVPESTRRRRAWRQAAALVSEYRTVYGITDPERALGPAPRDATQRAEWQRAQAAVERVHHKQRVAERDRDHEPTQMGSRRQQQSRRVPARSGTRLAGRVRSGPPASTTWKEATMASSSHPHPDNERERFPLPWEDDDTPGVSVHALTREDMEAILASMPDGPDDEPPLRLPSLRRAAAARRVRRQAYGTPGASAEAEYRCRRQVEHGAWARTLPLRLAATALAGLGGLLVVTVAGLPLPAGLLAAMLLVGAAWWRLRFRPSPEALAWQRGAAGERHVARLLEPLVRQGWGVNHDLRVPGSKANIDHVVVGPPGIFAIDAKHYRGRLRRSRDGLLWHGRTFLLPTLSTVRWEADMLQARIGAPDVAVVPIVAVVGATVPFGQVTAHDVTVIPARRLPGLLRSLPPSLTPQRAREVAAQIERRLDAHTGR